MRFLSSHEVLARIAGALLLINAVVVTNLALVGWSFEHLMYIISGWYSLGGALIAIYFYWQAVKVVEWIKTQTGGRDLNQIWVDLDRMMCEVKELVGSEELKTFLGLLVNKPKVGDLAASEEVVA